MEKKKEIIKLILSLIILAVLILVIMVITFLILQGFNLIGMYLGYFTQSIWMSITGVLMGIGAGFGFVAAKRLFEITFDK